MKIESEIEDLEDDIQYLKDKLMQRKRPSNAISLILDELFEKKEILDDLKQKKRIAEYKGEILNEKRRRAGRRSNS